jgi:hypothetical protein
LDLPVSEQAIKEEFSAELNFIKTEEADLKNID